MRPSGRVVVVLGAWLPGTFARVMPGLALWRHVVDATQGHRGWRRSGAAAVDAGSWIRRRRQPRRPWGFAGRSPDVTAGGGGPVRDLGVRLRHRLRSIRRRL